MAFTDCAAVWCHVDGRAGGWTNRHMMDVGRQMKTPPWRKRNNDMDGEETQRQINTKIQFKLEPSKTQCWA